MSLEIRVSPPTLRVTDTDGHVVFDALQHGMFYVTDVLNSYVDLPLYNSPPHNVGVDYTLGSARAGSTIIRGAMRLEGAGGLQLAPPVGGWFTVSGSFVHIANLTNFRAWSFVVEGGTVKLRDSVRLHGVTISTGQTIPLGAIRVHYHLLVGRFSG